MKALNDVMKKVTKLSTIYSIVVVMILPSTGYSMLDKKDNNRRNDWVGTVAQGMQIGTRGWIDLMQKQHALDQDLALKSHFAPKAGPDKRFGCIVPPIQPSLPKTMCSKDKELTKQNASRAASITKIAHEWDDHLNFLNSPITGQSPLYSSMLNEFGVQVPIRLKSEPFGVECLNNTAADDDKEFQKAINDLEIAKKKLITDLKPLKDQHKKLFQELKDQASLLNGTGNNGIRTDAEIKRAFGKNVSDQCNELVGSSVLENAYKTGLEGLRSALNKPKEDAEKVQKNSETFKRNVGLVGDKIAAYVKQVGIHRLGEILQPGNFHENIVKKVLPNLPKDSNKSALGNYDKVREVLATNYSTFIGEYNAINAELAQNGVTLPQLNKHFEKRLNTKLSPSRPGHTSIQDQIKEGFVVECMTDPSKQFIGNIEGPDGLLDRLVDGRGRRETGTVKAAREKLKDFLLGYKSRTKKLNNDVNDYKDEDKLLLRSDNIISAIQRLIASGGKKGVNQNSVVKFELKSPGKNIAYVTPLDYFKNAQQRCVSFYNTHKLPGVQANVFERLKDLQKQYRNFDSSVQKKNAAGNFDNDELYSNIETQVLACSGQSAPKGSCDPSLLNSKNDGFCLSQAQECAAEYITCHQDVEKRIEKLETKKQNKANQINAVVEAISSRQDQIYQNMLRTSSALQAKFKALWPKGDFPSIALPKIVTPERNPNENFNVFLRDSENLEELTNNIDVAINSLKSQLKAQKDTVKKEMNKYIQDYSRNIARIQGQWRKIKKDCTSLVQAYNTADKERIKYATEQQNEIRSADGKFCSLSKYAFLTQDCSKLDELVEAQRAASHVANNPSMSKRVGELMNFCRGRQNEKILGTEPVDEFKQKPLATACRNAGNNWEAAKEDANYKMLAALPYYLKGEAGKVKALLEATDISEKDIREKLKPSRHERDIAATSGNDSVFSDFDGDDSYTEEAAESKKSDVAGIEFSAEFKSSTYARDLMNFKVSMGAIKEKKLIPYDFPKLDVLKADLDFAKKQVEKDKIRPSAVTKIQSKIDRLETLKRYYHNSIGENTKSDNQCTIVNFKAASKAASTCINSSESAEDCFDEKLAKYKSASSSSTSRADYAFAILEKYDSLKETTALGMKLHGPCLAGNDPSGQRSEHGKSFTDIFKSTLQNGFNNINQGI